MAEPTLAELAKRIEAIEKQLAEQNSPQAQFLAWLRSPPRCQDEELVRQVHAEIEARREAEREAARAEGTDEPHIVE